MADGESLMKKETARNLFWKSHLSPTAFLAVLLVIGALLDNFTNGYTQLIVLYIFINSILALSLNLVNGFTGQFSLGHAGFMAIGAYTAGYLAQQSMGPGAPFQLAPPPFEWLNFPIYGIAGGLLAALAGWFVGLPSLRLKGDYLAIVTLGFAEIIRVILLNTEAVGGARGMYGIPGSVEVHFGSTVITPFFVSFFWASFWITITFFVHWRLVRSTHGRGFESVREDEIAAEAMGINTTSMKVRAFVISSFFAGIAGSLFAFATKYLNPSTFQFTKTVDVIIMVVLGGMGSLTGSVIAAIIVTIVPEFVLRPLQEYTGVDLRMVIYSLLLIIFMVVRPQGIFGRTEIIEFFRRKRGTTTT
jgi:branched-chain amino acid transport system permease protein